MEFKANLFDVDPISYTLSYNAKISGITTDQLWDVHTEFGQNRTKSASGRTLTSV